MPPFNNLHSYDRFRTRAQIPLKTMKMPRLYPHETRTIVLLVLWLLIGLGPWRCAAAADDSRTSSSYERDDTTTNHQNSCDHLHPVTTIYQFPPGTWVENLAVRRNGLLLVVANTSPLLYQLDPQSSTEEPPVVLYDFSAAGNGIQSITEVSEDVFAVEVATCNLTALSCTRGSFSVWEANLQQGGYGGSGGGGVRVRKVSDFPESGGLNGMATLKRDDAGSTILIADSVLGAIWRLDMRTGENSVVIRDESLAGVFDTIPIGVNGLQIRGNRLWFTNTGKGTLNVMPIDPVTGEKRGEARVVAAGLLPDDFELREEIEAFVCNATNDQLLVVGPLTGRGAAAPKVKVAAELAGPTSVRRGRSRVDQARRSLYVSTIGGFAQWVAGNVTVGGTVSRVDLKD